MPEEFEERMKLHPNTGFIFLAPNSSEKVLSCFVHLHVGGGGCYHYIPFHHIYRLFLISSWNERVGVTPRKIHRVLDPKTSHPVCWAMSLALVISSLLVSPCKTLIHHPEDGEGPWTKGTKKELISAQKVLARMQNVWINGKKKSIQYRKY